jgi:hypothetical protein
MNQHIAKRIIYVETTFDDGRKQGGTGVLLRCETESIVITCRHVVESNNSLGKVKVWPRGVAKTDEQSIHSDIIDVTSTQAPEDARDLVVLKLRESFGYHGIENCACKPIDELTQIDTIPVTIYGYPLGEQRLIKLSQGVVQPVFFDGNVGSIAPSGIYSLHLTANNPTSGVSGGGVFYRDTLIGIYRGKYSSPGYQEGIIISSFWVMDICEKAGYVPRVQETSLDIASPSSDLSNESDKPNREQDNGMGVKNVVHNYNAKTIIGAGEGNIIQGNTIQQYNIEASPSIAKPDGGNPSIIDLINALCSQLNISELEMIAFEILGDHAANIGGSNPRAFAKQLVLETKKKSSIPVLLDAARKIYPGFQC